MTPNESQTKTSSGVAAAAAVQEFENGRPLQTRQLLRHSYSSGVIFPDGRLKTPRAIMPLVKTLQIVWHEKEPVYSVDFHPDGTLVTAGADQEIKLWEVRPVSRSRGVAFDVRLSIPDLTCRFPARAGVPRGRRVRCREAHQHPPRPHEDRQLRQVLPGRYASSPALPCLPGPAVSTSAHCPVP